MNVVVAVFITVLIGTLVYAVSPLITHYSTALEHMAFLFLIACLAYMAIIWIPAEMRLFVAQRRVKPRPKITSETFRREREEQRWRNERQIGFIRDYTRQKRNHRRRSG